jgi:outer membrane receptor protein involved in Fe transport
MKISPCARSIMSCVAIGISVVPSIACAESLGKVRVSVRNIDDHSPVPGASVTLRDSKERGTVVTLVTEGGGAISSSAISPGEYVVTIVSPAYETERARITVLPGKTAEVAIELEPRETTIKVTEELRRSDPSETSSTSIRDKSFLSAFPSVTQNTQQITGLLATVPGFVPDSANQSHPRGEHSATSYYFNGFRLGGAAQGRFGPLIDPQALESVNIMTGGFSPEYAGDSALLDATIRSGTPHSFASGEVGAGNYDAALAKFTMGGQAGRAVGPADAKENAPRIFSYFISGSVLSTDNALEAPQPRNQTEHNSGDSQTLLARFDLAPSVDDKLSLIINASPAKTDVANRAGLPDKYAPYGQGYGFGGALSRADAKRQGIESQEQSGQDVYQRDRNNFSVLQWDHQFSSKVSSRLSLGADQSKISTRNQNPVVNLDALPGDNSIEYNPTVRRDTLHEQVGADVSYDQERHTFKFGTQYIHERGADSYQLIPASQLATNALYATDDRLAPAGKPVFDSAGNPVLDAQGNQVYQVNPGAISPTLDVESRGYYLAGFAQDTWRVTDTFTANYGLRYDRYQQRQNLGREAVDKYQFSPRANLSWEFVSSWVARGSYNRLFIQPPSAQGSIIGEPIMPERVSQFETSLEKRVTSRQTAKVAYYVKNIRNQVDTALFIPSVQTGMFQSVNLDQARIHGVELSYDLIPEHEVGLGSFVAYAYSVARPSGFDNRGEPVPTFNDHDQRHTLSTGLSYTFRDRSALGLNYYYGSGIASSALEKDGPRHNRDRIDLSLSSRPDLILDRGGLRLTVTNLLDERDLINFNSPFSGTRFQQGRTIMLSTFFDF